MKRTITIILLLPYLLIQGQNLVTNPDFELFTTCPMFYGDLNATGWTFGTPLASSDYFNTCGGISVGVPTNGLGFQASQSGNAYVGFATSDNFGGNYREYVQSTLTSPTVAGCYEIEIRYSQADFCSASTNLGVALTSAPPPDMFAVTPQLNITNVPSDITAWHTETISYVSPGGETTITLGNFYDDANTTFILTPGLVFSDFAYFYVDYVKVELTGTNTGNINVDLGPDIYVCANDFPVTINSNLPNFTNVWGNGNTGPSIQVNSPGEYTVQTINNCEFGLDTIEVFINPEPTFELNDTILCFGSDYVVQLDPTLGTYTLPDGSSGTQYTINQAGTYDFILDYGCTINQEIDVVYYNPVVIPNIPDYDICIDQLPLIVDLTSLDDGINNFIWSDNSINPVLVINQEGDYTVQVSNTCFTDSENFNVDTDPILPTTLPETNFISCDNQPISIVPGITDADLLWQDGSMELFFIAPGPGTYSVQATNACGSQVYNFNVFGGNTDPIILGSDISLCPGDSVLVSSDNGGILNWSTGEIAESIWVSTAQEVIANVSNICGMSSDTILISLDGSAPIVSLPDTLLICAGDTIQVQAAAQSNGANFIWNHGPTENTIDLFQAGTYYVEASNNCGNGNDSVTVVIGEPVPFLSIDTLTYICPGDTAFFSVDHGSADIIWSDGTSFSELAITTGGTFWVELSNSCAVVSDSFEVILLLDLPPIDLGPDQDLCAGDSLVLTDPNLVPFAIWNDGTLSNQLTVYTAGTYSVVSGSACNEVTDTIIINDLGPGPMVSLGNDFSICLGDTIDLTAQGNFDDILWENASMAMSQEITMPGSYLVTVTNACGISYDTLNVVLNQQTPIVDLGIDQFFCPGDSVLLDIGNVAGTVSWSNSSSDASSIYVFSGGEVAVSVSSACGIATDTINIQMSEALPELNVAMDTLLCIGETLDFNLNVAASVNILWDDGGMSPNKTISQAGTYWVEISNNCGVERDSIIVDFVPALSNFDLPVDMTICDSDSYTISPNPIIDQVDYLWSNGSIVQSLIVTQSGIYDLTISNSCEFKSDTVEIIFGDLVTAFNFDDVDTLCTGEVLSLDGDQGNQFDYLWQDGSINTDFEITQSGTYSLEVSSVCNTETSAIAVTVLPDQSFNLDLEANYLLCQGQGINIDIPTNLSTQILWNDGGQETSRFITEAGNYEIQLSNNCRDSLVQFIVSVEDCSNQEVYVPNIFSPNQDGVNDFFTLGLPPDWDILSAEVRVFDRWGELVFISEDPNFAWDGRFKERPLNPGVLVYVFEIKIDINDEIITINKIGDVSLIK